MLRLKQQDDELQAVLHSEEHSQNVNHDKQMLRGFTHEISNLVTGNLLILMSAQENEVTLCHKNAEHLSGLFDLIENDITPEKKAQVLDYFRKIEQNEQRLDHAIKILTNSNTRAVDVARLVLEYSRLGRVAVTKELVQLQNVLEAVVQKHQQEFIEHRISVRLTGSATRTIVAHRPHLHTIFNNLILNTCQAFMELKEARERVLAITLMEEENRQIVIIRDNANGIEKEHLPEIFEPFYTTSPKTAIGLGLSFVAKLISLYQGMVDVESEPGKGTAFTLTFRIC